MGNKEFYSRYYKNQAGSGLAVYHGFPQMSGRGFGSFITRAIRKIQPILAKFLPGFKTEVIKSGVNVLNDVIRGGIPVKESLKTRTKEAATNLINRNLRGKGIKRLACVKKTQSKRARRDIFTR